MESSLNNQNLLSKPLLLKERLQQIPNIPGCYLLFDSERRLLYVGKSKHLKDRVRSYFRNNQYLSPRIKLMVRQISDIEIIVTDNESEALTLESNLIKDRQPYFNVLLKDDKKYPYLCITWSEEYPRLVITRRRRKRNELDRYYGPYVDVGLLRKTLFLVKRVFPLRQRLLPLYKNRTCLNYSIGRCPGVCQQKISPELYRKTLNQVAMIFQGRSQELIKLLRVKMQKYSLLLEFEKAAELRDQISGLETVHQDQKMILPDSSISWDVIGISSDDKNSAIQIFQIRCGKLVGRLGYVAPSSDTQEEIILKRIIEEHYSLVEPVEVPNEILLQFQLQGESVISEWLSDFKGRRVKISCPKRNKKYDYVELVKRNANYELIRLQKGYKKDELALEDLASLLQLDKLPKRIEGFDISHTSGADTVASQVVFINGIEAKQHYRKYKIKNKNIRLGHSDDFLSLDEVIERRFKKWSLYKRNNGDIDPDTPSAKSKLDISALTDWPDLLMIDGGKGQLSAVMKTLQKLNLDNEVLVCSLAKKNEEIFLPGNSSAITSNPDQPGVLLLRRIRDEAHRFAINFHRYKRGQRLTRSSLQDIPGIGPKRIKTLLNHFQSIDAIKIASLQELNQTPSLGKEMALKVWEYFNLSHTQ